MEEKIATHSNILAWEIPQTEEPGSPWVRKRVGHNLVTKKQEKAELLYKNPNLNIKTKIN